MAENNPLTEEQLKELNEIVSLPPEKQKERLGPFLKSLNPEQREFLKKQQGQGQECLFCAIANKKIETKIIYEDNNYLGFLDVNPANKGHVLVIPKEHISFSTQIDDAGKLFNIANNMAKKIFDVLKTGSNIFVANGAEAGQRLNHLVVHVIPRFENDNINLTWQGKKIDDKEMGEMQKKLRIEVEKPKVKEYNPEERKNEENKLMKMYERWNKRVPL